MSKKLFKKTLKQIKEDTFGCITYNIEFKTAEEYVDTLNWFSKNKDKYKKAGNILSLENLVSIIYYKGIYIRLFVEKSNSWEEFKNNKKKEEIGIQLDKTPQPHPILDEENTGIKITSVKSTTLTIQYPNGKVFNNGYDTIRFQIEIKDNQIVIEEITHNPKTGEKYKTGKFHTIINEYGRG